MWYLLESVRNIQRVPSYNRIPMAAGRKMSSEERWELNGSNFLFIFLFGAVFAGVTFQAIYDPWKPQRWEAQLENYNSERYVQPRDKSKE